MKACYFCSSRDTEEVVVRNLFDVSRQAHFKICKPCAGKLEQITLLTRLEIRPTPEADSGPTRSVEEIHDRNSH